MSALTSAGTVTEDTHDVSLVSKLAFEDLLHSDMGMDLLFEAIRVADNNDGKLSELSTEQLIELEERVATNFKSQQDPDEQLDPAVEIPGYFQSLHSDHYQDIYHTARLCDPMHAECRLSIVIPVAGLQEGGTIYRTLQSFTEQSVDPNLFELVLFENVLFGSDLPDDFTGDEVIRFKEDYPYMNTCHVFGGLEPEELTIGYLRKYANDFPLQRHLNRGTPVGEHYLVRTDADTYGVHQRFVENYLKKSADNPNVDAFTGNLDFALEHFAHSPLIHFGHRLFTHLGNARRRNGCESSLRGGANLAVKASTYARVRGYSSVSTVGEDLDFDQKLLDLRSGATEHTAIMPAGSRSRLFSSARRGAWALLKHDMAPVEQWNPGETEFGGENVDIRSWDLGPDRARFLSDLHSSDLVSKLENIANRTIPHYLGTPQEGARDFDPHLVALDILDRMGVKARFLTQDSVRIKDVSSFQQKMRLFIDTWQTTKQRITNQPEL